MGSHVTQLNKGDTFTLKEDLKIWTPSSVGTILKGTEILIQQVSLDRRKYLVDNTWMAVGIIHNVM
jgi:hypothetical protein